MSSVTTSHPRTPPLRYIGLGGGIALEWYDWSIYGLMAAFMGPHFFPSEDPVTSTLSTLAVSRSVSWSDPCRERSSARSPTASATRWS